MKNLKEQKPKRECVYRWIFPSRSIDFYQKKLPSKALVNMTRTDILSTDVLSPRVFCPQGRFVRRTFCPLDVLSSRTFCLTDVLSLRMFCPHRRFVPMDVLSPWTFCPHGRSVHGCFVSGRFVWASYFLIVCTFA